MEPKKISKEGRSFLQPPFIGCASTFVEVAGPAVPDSNLAGLKAFPEYFYGLSDRRKMIFRQVAEIEFNLRRTEKLIFWVGVDREVRFRKDGRLRVAVRLPERPTRRVGKLSF